MQQEKLTILVPFRNRENNLKVFIPYMKDFFATNHPDINYEIVIIEQGNEKLFNKGILLNIGFLITSGNTDYYDLHDVDQLPIAANFSYNKTTYQLFVNNFEQNSNGVLVNINKEKFDYSNKGGVIIITKDNYMKANGHSNNYWGWGCEDDDFVARINFAKIGMYRYRKITEHDCGYFLSLNAKSIRFKNNENYSYNVDYAQKVIREEIDWKTEGLNTTKFNIINIIKNDDYTKYIVDFENDVNRL